MQYETLEIPLTNTSLDGEDDKSNGMVSKTQQEKDRKRRANASIVIEHVDLIKDDFWERKPWLLSGKVG